VRAAALGLAVAALAAVGGCKDAAAPAAAPAPAVKPADAAKVSVETIESQARGFNVGAAMSARVVYVFFDSQCPHCAVLWESAKPLRSKARFVWIPVGVLNGNSVTQGAAILAAPDPAAAMEQHETSLRERNAGIIAVGNVDAQKEAVARNTRLLDGFGIASVPTLVTRQGDGAVKVQEGAMPTDKLAQWLGLNP
jgi:thiol:disulfide interchange protein DsbG